MLMCPSVLLALPVGLATVLALSACGSDSGSSEPGTSDSAAASEPPAAATPPASGAASAAVSGSAPATSAPAASTSPTAAPAAPTQAPADQVAALNAQTPTAELPPGTVPLPASVSGQKAEPQAPASDPAKAAGRGACDLVTPEQMAVLQGESRPAQQDVGGSSDFSVATCVWGGLDAGYTTVLIFTPGEVRDPAGYMIPAGAPPAQPAATPPGGKVWPAFFLGGEVGPGVTYGWTVAGKQVIFGYGGPVDQAKQQQILDTVRMINQNLS